MPPPFDPGAPVDDQRTSVFLARQSEAYGGNLEVEPDLWILFAVEAGNAADLAAAEHALREATFEFRTAESEDDAWILYCVDGANRPEAVFWLQDMLQKLTGRIRSLAPAHRGLVDELAGSPMPHRNAKRLAELHSKGEVPAGSIHRREVVRSLLDRLHGMEPLFFAAFQTLLDHHLIDLVVLTRNLLDEDVRLQNDVTRGSLSHDPFFQTRQAASARIRDQLVACHVISPMDQQKSASSSNPYVSITDMQFSGDDVILRIDGIDKRAPKGEFLDALRRIRKSLYRGTRLDTVNTQTPWITESTAYPLRFIKLRVQSNPGLSALDWLYMLERAVDPDAVP